MDSLDWEWGLYSAPGDREKGPAVEGPFLAPGAKLEQTW